MKLRSVTETYQSCEYIQRALPRDSCRKTDGSVSLFSESTICSYMARLPGQGSPDPGTCESPEEESPRFLWARYKICLKTGVPRATYDNVFVLVS